MPAKHFEVQAAINKHLSQPTGAGAWGGQQGMSFAISSAVADDDSSSAMACIEASEDIAAITGRESGANARPAIMRTASSRRMARFRFTDLISHRTPIEYQLNPARIDPYQVPASGLVHLSIRAANHGYQFGYLLPLIGLVAAGDRVFDAMRHVIF